jgi:hypothetical protein
MKNEAWQAKSCNTVLAGWAQLRHTWVLQAKQTFFCWGSYRSPPGFVEPEPEFFSRMANLAVATRKILRQSGAFEPDYNQLADWLEAISACVDETTNFDEFSNKIRELEKKGLLDLYSAHDLMLDRNPEPKKWSEDWLKDQKQWLDSMIPDIRAGRIGNYPEIQRLVERDEFNLDNLWGRLEATSRRLEVIAHKQLRHVEPNKGESRFMDDYGDTLAGIMLYAGNHQIPRDDAPRVVDVYANPKRGGYLHVGVARPRKMYVLYPWNGRTILCEGAVMPYYEFVSASRLTDESWKVLLDSDERPAIPKWFAPVVSGGGLSKPILKNNEQPFVQ